jgi:hypothetical protein
MGGRGMMEVIAVGLMGAVVYVLLKKLFVLEDALIAISHYHGNSVEELRDIAYKARKWPWKYQ